MKLGKRLNRRRQGNSKLSVGDAYEILERRNLLATYTVDFSQLAPSDYSSSEILVRFHDDVSVDDLKKINHVELMNHNAILSASLGEGFRADGQLFEIPVIAGQSIPDLIDYYNSLDAVEFAEPNYLMESTAVPNDQYYGYQWGPPNINAESAWDTRTDSSSIIVGVIDSGVQYDHPDLQPNIWTNSGEIAGNGIDDDNNGYVDDFYGYDFDNDDSDPMDDNGHGTHVAGTIGAQGNNSFGVAGVGWDASLMSLKVIGGGSNADVARAIDYATDNGAKITNNSYGYAGTNVGGSSVMSAAIGRAKDAGVLYVVAAGNSRTGIPASDMDGSFNSWPAEYSKIHDNVITVGAIDESGAFASYSHWGDESVQIAAPGTTIASTYTNNGYVYLSGTSMASPHVAGAAALLWAERPEMSYLEIKDAILNNTRADHLNLVTNGVLDLGLAMTAITSSTNSPPVAVNDTATVDEDSFVAVNVLQNDSDPDNDTLSVQSFTSPSNGSVSASNGILTYTPDANFNGSDSFNYTINDGNGNTDTATVSITVDAVNDNPVASDDSSVTNEDTAVLINVISNDTDVDGDSLTVDSVNQPANGTVVNNGDGTVTYTPANGFFGVDTFSYTVSDGSLSDSANVSVTVNEVVEDDPPVANNDNAIVNEDSQVGVPVLANDDDPNGDTLAIDSFTQASNGTVTQNNDILVYTPDDDFNGSDSFSYTINDGNGNTDSATVFVTINAVNDNPVANNDSGTTDENVPIIVDLVGNDSDIDGDTLSIDSFTQPANGIVTDNGDGTITYAPDSGFFGSDSFTYTVTDGNLTDSATVQLTVNEVGGGTSEIGFAGTAIDVTHVWKTINLPVSFTNPVVVAGGSTRDGGHQGIVRVRNVTANSFQIRFQEWDYRDGRHTTENMGYLVVEAGTHTLTDGTQIVAGTTTLTNESTRTISFGDSFSGTPLVLAQTMTNNDEAAVVERIRAITNSNFKIQFNEEEIADGVHATETVGYIAIDQGTAVSGDTALNAVTTGNTVTHQNSTVNFGDIGGATAPVILSDMQTRDGGDAASLRHRSQTSTSVTVWVEEEQSKDSELNHTTEVAGVLAMEAGVLVANTPSFMSGSANGSMSGLDSPTYAQQLAGAGLDALYLNPPQIAVNSGNSNSAFLRVEDTITQKWNSAKATGDAAENTTYEFLIGSVDPGEILTAEEHDSETEKQLSAADRFFAELSNLTPASNWGI
ncbi:MAG: Ig-like domain-containing protein [Mariniblastus sp.]